MIAGFYFLKSPSEGDYKKLVQNETVLETKGYSGVPIQPVNVSSVEQQYPPSEVKMEIEVSSQEILDADSEGLIGNGNNPFGARFITEEDVKASIDRIIAKDGMDIEQFDLEYQEYIINLRHLEMTDHINELDSQVKKVASEYKEKILTNKQ